MKRGIAMKRITSLLLVLALFISMSYLSFAESASISTINESKNQNPYVQAYFGEKGEDLKSNALAATKASDQLVADPNEEEKIIISTLEEYYQEDMKVAELLKNYCEESVCSKILKPNKQDKTDTMLKIKDIYYSLNDTEQNVLKGYISRYVTASDNNLLKEFYTQIKNNSNSLEVSSSEISSSQVGAEINTIATYTGYNDLQAANWAYNNYQNTATTNYPYFDSSIYGSDCANFVSQAMHEGGGMPMMGNWYCNKKNSTYPIPANATQLNYSWSLSDPSPWISVTSLKSFLDGISPMALSFSYTKAEYVTNHATIYNSSITLGSVVLLCKGLSWVQLPTHAMIISRYDSINRDFLLAAHSNPRRDHPLLTAIDSYAGVIFYRIN